MMPFVNPREVVPGEREGRCVRLRSRTVSGHALQGAVDQAARYVRRDSNVHHDARVVRDDGAAGLRGDPGLPRPRSSR